MTETIVNTVAAFADWLIGDQMTCVYAHEICGDTATPCPFHHPAGTREKEFHEMVSREVPMMDSRDRQSLLSHAYQAAVARQVLLFQRRTKYGFCYIAAKPSPGQMIPPSLAPVKTPAMQVRSYVRKKPVKEEAV
jgi:hypothetical protein